MEIYETVAQYLIHSDPNLVQVVTISEDAFARFARGGLMSNDFAYMFLEDNEALRDGLRRDAGLHHRDGDGQAGSGTHHRRHQRGRDHPHPDVRVDSAETIWVAVTGALPPMDYVAADGTPTGFNAALLAEIIRRMGKNIELVIVDSVGRAAALTSSSADAGFWTRTCSKSNDIDAASEEEHIRRREARIQEMSQDELETIEKVTELVAFADYGRADQPENTIVTEPYFSDIVVTVATQARLDRAAAQVNQ